VSRVNSNCAAVSRNCNPQKAHSICQPTTMVTKIIHTAVATAANMSDVAVLPDLLHGEETRVWGDGTYQGQSDVIRECAPRARDFTQQRCRYQGQIVDEVAWAKNRTRPTQPSHGESGTWDYESCAPI
jgi:IS5 family transposase